MELWQAAVLGVVQGITEFFPVSSSGHLILIPQLFGWEEQSLAFDAFVHLATLIAILVALRDDVVETLRSKRLAIYLVIAALPVLLVGFFARDWIATTIRTPSVVVAALIGWGIVLFFVDRRVAKNAQDNLQTMSLKKTLAVGCAQILALIPGTSRSGITITAGLALGLSRAAAARFSFLIGVPAIFVAGGYGFYQLLTIAEAIAWAPVMVGFVAALISGVLAIKLLVKMLASSSYVGFVAYRILLALVMLNVVIY